MIAHPAEAVPVVDPGAALGRAARALAREPLVCRLPGLAVTLYDACVTREVPVRLFDPGTGAPLRGFRVPATGPAVRAWFDAGALVVATGDRVVWIK